MGEEVLLRKGGDVGKVVWALGGELLAPHIDVERVKNFFGERHKVDQFALLEQIARVGVPVDVGPGGNLERELAYGNHSSARKHVADVWENAVGDVKNGRAIVMPVRVARSVRGLRINPVGVVEEKGKRRIVHDSTFSSEPELPGGGGAVNETTYWDQIPECHLAGVMGQIIKRVLGLRDKFGTGKRILIKKMDVKSVFRQVGVDPAGAANFGYVLGGYLFIDLRLQFGWRGSPGWWGVIASVIQQAQGQTTKASATILAAGKEATAHVKVAGHTGVAVEPLPRGCMVEEVEGEGEEDPAWVVFSMDDAVSVKVKWEAGEGGCLVLSQALASNHHQAMGERAVGEEHLLSH